MAESRSTSDRAERGVARGSQALQRRYQARLPLLIPAAAGFVLGCCWGSSWGGAPRDVALFAAFATILGACAAVAAVLSSRQGMSAACLALACVTCGVAWRVARSGPARTLRDAPSTPIGTRSVPALDGTPILLDDEGALVRVSGFVSETPHQRPPPPEPAARQGGRPDDEFFLVDVDVHTDSAPYTLAGRVRVVVAACAPTLAIGDRVEAMGWLHASRPSSNPRRVWRAPRDPLDAVPRTSVVATLQVADAELVRVVSPAAARTRVNRWLDTAVGLQNQARMHVGDVVDRALPAWSSADARGLIHMMLLGRDDRAPTDLEEDFAEAGLAHLVAISGFNLAVLAGAVSAATRSFSTRRPISAAIVVVTTLAYALLVEPQAPVARAAIVAVLASVADMSHRRWYGDALLSFAAAAIVVVRPEEASAPGFQLTFLSVLALRHLAPTLQERWYGSGNSPPEHLAQAALFALRSLITSSVSVWIATAPIGLFHFGRVALVGVPLSIIAIPVGTVMLVASYATAAIALFCEWLGQILGAGGSAAASMLLGLVSSSRVAAASWTGDPGSGLASGFTSWIAAVPAVVATLGAEALIRLARLAGTVPFASVALPSPSIAWCVLAVIAATAWCRAKRRRGAKLAFGVLALLWSPLALAAVRGATMPYFEIRMLSVGDGSCYLVQSGASAVVFDAGSSSTQHVEDRILGPALEEAHVDRLDAVVVTHPDLDHYSAVVQLIEKYHVGTLIVTDRFIEAAGLEQSDLVSGGDVARVAPPDAGFRNGSSPSSGRTAHGRVDSRVRVLSGVAVPEDANVPVTSRIDSRPRTVLAAAHRRGVPVQIARRGQALTFGHATWRWLHPNAGENYRSDNDSSQTIRVSCPTAYDDATLLLTGDLETEGIASVLRIAEPLDCDLLELPHHGSWRPAVKSLLDRAAPGLVLQSTGPRRLRHDRFEPLLAGIIRCVSSRDGAFRLALDPQGGWRIWHWENDHWTPHGRLRPRSDTADRSRPRARAAEDLPEIPAKAPLVTTHGVEQPLAVIRPVDVAPTKPAVVRRSVLANHVSVMEAIRRARDGTERRHARARAPPP